MIATVLRISWLDLRRDPVALALTFALPLVFFSIFAAVFGQMDRVGETVADTALVVADRGAAARELADALEADPRLRLVRRIDIDIGSGGAGSGTTDDGARAARDLIRAGAAAVAIILPEGTSRALAGGSAAPVEIELLADTAQPLAVQVARGVLQTRAIEAGLRRLGAAPAAAPPLAVRVVDVLGEGGIGGKSKRPSIAYFAAGIGVMFLLFAAAGRSAILIDERDSGVLDRMLASRLGIGRLLLGHWLFLTLLGFVQVSVMFVWGALVFGLDLWTARHLAGFAAITAASAAAAAAFGVVLASACRSRAQLNGVAVVTVLVMSALGGSMFPRFLMPESLQAIGRFTFNAWALDGYREVFWYEAGIGALSPELAVLAALTGLGLLTARLLARRWETAS